MNSYPPALKTILKTGPVIVVMATFGLIFSTFLYDSLYHPHERIEKFFFRSNRFEKAVRTRDQRLRNQYFRVMDWQPSDYQMSVQRRPLVSE